MRIGLISDTHSYLDPQVFNYFKECDEIWHAGDIGDISVLNDLKSFKPTKAIHGNIDDKEIQFECPENLRFEKEGLNIWMTHIGGYPPRYNKDVKPILREDPPDIFICGHSHVLRVMHDKQFSKPVLYLNPGAAGKHGFHKVNTLLRFDINKGKVENMQVIELGKRA